MPRKNIPSYRLHKPTGQAIVSLQGKIFYLGKYKSKASWEEYNRIIAEFLANGKKLPPTRSNNDISIEELAARFLEYAESYYVKNGKQTFTVTHCRLALSPLVQHYGQNSVGQFGPLSLVFLRDKWVERKIARQTVNRWVDIIRQAFRWGVAHELVDSGILHALESVDNLKAGRTTAHEYQAIKPVSNEIIEKTLPHCPPIIADMIRLLVRQRQIFMLTKIMICSILFGLLNPNHGGSIMNTEKYIVRLSDAERQELQAIVKKRKGTSQTVKRAIALLKADADGPNWTNEKIHELTELSVRTISNLRKQLVREGFEATLNRKKRRLPPVPPKLDGLQEAQIIATRCGSPPEGFAKWSLRLLADQVVVLEIVDSCSHELVRKVLKKTV